ncbi:MAG: ArsR family transcriptional regulator [Pseudonocardiales bacterium]|nr:MAG: ArsR family transcriptional regulator [Pseudonocardiales bacterium]
MLRQQRDLRIVQQLRARGPASVHDLARELGVSASTVRRDLGRLDRDGELRRVYGGASPRAVPAEKPFPESLDTQREVKEAVAARAVELIRDDDVVLLDIGTTTLFMARRLHGRPLTIITSSLAVLDELRDDHAIQLVVLGGVVRRNYRSLVGALTEAALRVVCADRLFLSCTGIRRNGDVIDDTSIETPLKQAMLRASQSTVLLSRSGKFPGTGAVRVCSVADVDTVVTDAGSDEATLERVRESGGTVVFA